GAGKSQKTLWEDPSFQFSVFSQSARQRIHGGFLSGIRWFDWVGLGRIALQVVDYQGAKIGTRGYGRRYYQILALFAGRCRDVKERPPIGTLARNGMMAKNNLEIQAQNEPKPCLSRPFGPPIATVQFSSKLRQIQSARFFPWPLHRL